MIAHVSTRRCGQLSATNTNVQELYVRLYLAVTSGLIHVLGFNANDYFAEFLSPVPPSQPSMLNRGSEA